MTEHAVVIAGGGPTGLMLAAELALAGVDVAIVERRASQDLTGPRTCGLHSRAAGIEFPGWDATTGCMIAEVEMAEEPAWGYAATRSGSIP
jgi:glycine/D-amino acid oxidase-like deaminating enzyme